MGARGEMDMARDGDTWQDRDATGWWDTDGMEILWDGGMGGGIEMFRSGGTWAGWRCCGVEAQGRMEMLWDGGTWQSGDIMGWWLRKDGDAMGWRHVDSIGSLEGGGTWAGWRCCGMEAHRQDGDVMGWWHIQGWWHVDMMESSGGGGTRQGGDIMGWRHTDRTDLGTPGGGAVQPGVGRRRAAALGAFGSHYGLLAAAVEKIARSAELGRRGAVEGGLQCANCRVHSQRATVCSACKGSVQLCALRAVCK